MERANEQHDLFTKVGAGDSAAVVRPDGSPAGSGITVYGAWWCGDTRRAVGLLDRLELAFAYVDVDAHPAANAWAAARNGGQRRIPVVVLGGGPTLIEPSDDALLAALGETGYLAAGRDRAGAARHGRGAIPAR